MRSLLVGVIVALLGPGALEVAAKESPKLDAAAVDEAQF